MKLSVLSALFLIEGPLLAVSPKYQDAIKARIENGFAVVMLSNGSKTMAPLADMKADDRAFLTKLSIDSPLAHGNAKIVIAMETVAAKVTIATSTVAGPVETVQLIPPNVPRDQIGGTCMLYARVHWMDIAGYYVDNVDIYKIINNADTDTPYKDPGYYMKMENLVMQFHPSLHRWSPKTEPFEWTRQELRKGRPVLAAFPREIWQDLPPGFVGKHPWNGGNVGHQVVINGFTWNSETHEGTFHIVNSWKELPEFDLKTEAARGAMDVEYSISPKGEPKEALEVARVTNVTLVKVVGNMNLYEVDTTNGTERVVAADAANARSMVESANSN